MDSAKIKAIFVAVVGLYLGIAVVTAQFQAIAWVLGSLTLITIITLGSRVWMIIPLAMALDITLRIPGQPSTLLLASCKSPNAYPADSVLSTSTMRKR